MNIEQKSLIIWKAKVLAIASYRVQVKKCPFFVYHFLFKTAMQYFYVNEHRSYLQWWLLSFNIIFNQFVCVCVCRVFIWWTLHWWLSPGIFLQFANGLAWIWILDSNFMISNDICIPHDRRIYHSLTCLIHSLVHKSHLSISIYISFQ